MCTALTYKTKKLYFGRNLDIDREYGECIVITPRHYFLPRRFGGAQEQHYAMIGTGAIGNGYPLYFEATNEAGLSMAGLHFPGNAFYQNYREGKENVAPFELIPYLLGMCANLAEIRQMLDSINVVHCDFREDMPTTPLHWLISDKNGSMTLECTMEGMKIYENPFGVLTNNPPFDFHLAHVNLYKGLHERTGENRLAPELPLHSFSQGSGAFGLPGDFSSSSRFVKALFMKEKSFCEGGEWESINQFFHILQGVAMPKGCVVTESGALEYTRYSCCCNTEDQVYYYTTYENSTIRKIEMKEVDLEGNSLSVYTMGK